MTDDASAMAEPELLDHACAIARQLADIASVAGQHAAAAYFSMGADVLKAHADLLGQLG